MQRTVGESLAERLIEGGVDTVFGPPGDGINGLTAGFRRDQDTIRFVLVHHEEAAAFLATGYAKATGRLGVCVATSGPGAIHLLGSADQQETQAFLRGRPHRTETVATIVKDQINQVFS